MAEPAVSFGELLWGTVLLRPYVFIYLATYLCLATWHLGLGRTLIYLVSGYAIAWTAEFSSIHNGFPFGLYIYIPATRHQELWILGVPFMDSLSFVFLSYASYSLALLLLAGRRQAREATPAGQGRDSAPRLILLAAALFTAVDVAIDPLSLRGYRWFLGQIYGYPEPSLYFGIPLSNFIGWFLVGLVMITLLHHLGQWRPEAPWLSWGRRHFPGVAYLGAGLYTGVLLFILFMTFYIGETLLGLVGVLIFLPVYTLAGSWWHQARSRGERLRDTQSYPP